MITIPSENEPRPRFESSNVLSLPGLRIQLIGSKPTILLSGHAIRVATQISARRELIDRFFSIQGLESLRLNWMRGEVRVEFAKNRKSPSEIATLFANAMRRSRPAALPLPHEEVILGDAGSHAFGIRRSVSGLTLWQVDAPSSRIFRLTHPLLRSDFVRKQVLEELATIADVLPRSIFVPVVGSESLIVFVRPHRIDAALFSEVLDPVLTRCLRTGPPHRLPNLHDAVVNGNLGIALVTDLLFPPLGIINIVLTSLLSTGYLRRALFALRQGKFSLDLLYLVIAAFTVATFQFVPSALMYWLMRFWPRRTRELYESHHSRFLARYRLRPRRVWIDRDGTSLETRIEDLKPSSVVTLTAGDIVPGDGLVVEGDGQIDEQLFTGPGTPVSKTIGSAIYAASRVVDGSVRIRIKSLGDDTAAGRLTRWYSEAPGRASTSRASQKAERTVLPVLLVSALALLQGGPAMAKATLRPDYASSLLIAEHLGSLEAIIRAANEGILLNGNSPFEKLIAPAVVVFDDTVRWLTPENHETSFTEVALAQGLQEVVFFSNRSQLESARLAATLGFDSFFAGSSTATKRAYIAERQRAGRTVIYVGDCRAESAVAAQADLAIAVTQPPFDRLDSAAVALLSPDLLKVLDLRVIVAKSIKNIDTAFAVSSAPNITAVLSAFFFAMPVYASILLTNAGTFANYVRSETRLHLAQSSAKQGIV